MCTYIFWKDEKNPHLGLIEIFCEENVLEVQKEIVKDGWIIENTVYTPVGVFMKIHKQN